MKKLYLAGPDVFLEDAKEYGVQLKKICAEYGFLGLFPLDNEIQTDDLHQKQIAKKIQQSNIELIQKCDGVIANLSFFRGCEPDSGTVWEVGYASALGKKVIGYASDLRTVKEKSIEILGLDIDAKKDTQNLFIEDFGLSHNLMFADVVCCESFEEALRKIKKSLE